MNWMKYLVLAAPVTAVGWVFLLVFAPPAHSATYEIISAPLSDNHGGYHHADTHHPEHEDHIDPEPAEMYEGARGYGLGNGGLPSSLSGFKTPVGFAHAFKEQAFV